MFSCDYTNTCNLLKRTPNETNNNCHAALIKDNIYNLDRRFPISWTAFHYCCTFYLRRRGMRIRHASGAAMDCWRGSHSCPRPIPARCSSSRADSMWARHLRRHSLLHWDYACCDGRTVGCRPGTPRWH